MTPKAYHKARIPFFLNPNGFIYVTQKYSGTHEMWAGQLDLPAEAMENWARGFYWPLTNQLFFYVGMYTTDYERVTDQMKKAIEVIYYKVGANKETLIHGGMIPGEPGTVWTPVKEFGTIEQFRGEQ